MRQSDWKRQYRRARCGAKRVNPKALAVYLNRCSHWETCAALRAHWLTKPTMRAHKLSLISDCRRTLATWQLRLP